MKPASTKIISGLWLAASIALMELCLQCGCTVGPDYQHPAVPANPAWSSPLQGGETNTGPVDAVWWKTFHDAELDALITRAAQSNLTLRIAEARVREARAQRGVVAAAEGPNIESEGSYSRNRFSHNGFPPLPSTTHLDYNLYRAGFDASWEIDVFGGTRRAVQAADAGIAAAEFGRDDVLRTLFGEVARNYIDARAFQRRLEIAHQNIDAQQEIVHRTQDRFHAGLATELDVQQAIALLASTEAEVPTLETGFRDASYQLDVLIGQPPGRLSAELSTNGIIPIGPPQVPVGLPSDLLLRRPDVRRAESELVAATAHIGEAKADLFPRFALVGVAGLQSISASDWWSAGSRFWSAGPSVTWPVFESGRIRANIRVQNARQEETLAGYEQTVLVAFAEVERSLTAYAREQIRRQSLVQSVQANQKALVLADDLYGHGLTDFLRVLVSQRGLYESQDALVQSDQAVALNLVALYKSLGGGWEMGDSNQKPQLSSTSN
jgi:multidrug efflux system outer membrane protein